MSEYRNRRGKPISVLEWRRKFEDANYRAVSNDLLDNGMQVSTFWVGVADGASAASKPLFETLVFGGENDHRKRTYTTLSEAIRGHRKIVDKLRGGLGTPDDPHQSSDNPGQHGGAGAKGKVFRHQPSRPWVLAMVPRLSERLRSDARLDVIAGAHLQVDGCPSAGSVDDDLSDALDPATMTIDLLIRESAPSGWIPRVAIQCLSGAVSARDVRACDNLAACLHKIHPALRNGMMIRNVGHIPPTLIQHGTHFDFIAALDAQTPATDGHSDLVTVLLDEVQSARVVSSMISSRHDRKRCTLIHRPMFLPGNQ